MELGKTANGTDLAQRNHSGPVGKIGRDHVNYWKARLEKRSYEWEGKTVEIPEFQIRLCYLNRREWFNLGTANEASAASKAREIYRSLTGKGWEQTLAIYKPQPGVATGAGLTITQFCELFRERRESVERPVSIPTAERYLKSLTFICREARITRLDALTEAKIESFKDSYLADAKKEKRDKESAKVSCNTQIRNAAALFSKKLLAAYAKKGHKLSNPFTGQQVRGVKLQTYTPVDQSVIDALWADSVLLRDGDPKAKAPDENAARWDSHDFRQPNLAAYGLLLLELGLGLRRNEADKAQKDWITKQNGRRILTVQETPHFKPKSKESRPIPIDDAGLVAALETVMDSHVSPFIIPGRLPKQHDQGKEPKNLVYRCDSAHRHLTAWLRQRGLTSDKPCHQLRKEFGSYVATSFTLFAAQKYLGHSSPNVTAQFYAGLKDLPKLAHVKLEQKTA